MNAPDTNLLIYAYDKSSVFHPRAKAYLEDSLNEEVAYGLTILSAQGFIRFAKGPALKQGPIPLEHVLAIVDVWLLQPKVRMLYPGPMHWRLSKHFAVQGRMQGKRYTDAAIAAIAVEHNATVHTNDRDFAGFPNLRWLNPLTNANYSR